MKYDLYDTINYIYFDKYEYNNVKYMKQRIVMRIYNRLRMSGRTLSDIWNQVNLYFHYMNNPVQDVLKKVESDPYSHMTTNYRGD